MELKALTQNYSHLISKKDAICFGISPFNSRFSKEYMDSLISFGKQSFKRVVFFIPDEPIVFTLMAIGYDEKKAKIKAKKQNRYLLSKIMKAFESNNFTLEQSKKNIFNSCRLKTNKTYQNQLKKTVDIFHSNAIFKERCLNSSRWILSKYCEEDNITTQKLELAVQYFLAEIPFFSHSNIIIDSEHCIFSYHETVDFFSSLYNKELPITPSANQGFAVVKSQLS